MKRVASYAPSTTRRLIGGVYDFSATHPSSNQQVYAFPKGVTTSLTYRLEELGGTPESSLGIFYFNEQTANWEAIPSQLDRQGRVVTAAVSHFSQYAILGAPVDPNQPSFGAPANHGFDTPAYAMAAGPDNTDFDAPAYVCSVQLTNHDFESGDLTGWSITGTGGIAFGGYDNSYHVSMQLRAGLTSSPFTIPDDAQTIHAWIYTNSGSSAQLFRASDGVQVANFTYNTGSAWKDISFNVASLRGTSVTLRFSSDNSSDIRIDSVQLDSTGNWLGTNSNCGYDGEPVNMTTGNYLYSHEDLSIPGRGLGLTLSRSYNSLGTGSSIFGNRWSFNYGMTLEVNADNSATITHPDGRRVTYTRNANGSYNRPSGVYDSLVKNGDGSFTLTTKSQARFFFASDSKLASIADRNGNTLSLSYTGGILRSVADPAGRALTFSYGAAGELQVLATPTAALAFPNADFEQESYANWTVEGTAFGANPTNAGDAGKQGTYYAGSYRGTGTDAAIGVLTSVPFTAGRQLLFRVNGGTDAANLKVSLLLADDSVALSYTNNTNTLELRSVAWDTTPWEGQQVRIRVTDNATGSWGHQGIDEVRVVHAPSGTAPAPLGNGLLPFANANFEDRSYLNWFATGTAFGMRPVANNDAGKEGLYYANSYDPTASDASTGTLTSAPFTAGRNLSFLINGGNKPNSAYVALLLADGSEVLKTTHAANTKTLVHVG